MLHRLYSWEGNYLSEPTHSLSFTRCINLTSILSSCLNTCIYGYMHSKALKATTRVNAYTHTCTNPLVKQYDIIIISQFHYFFLISSLLHTLYLNQLFAITVVYHMKFILVCCIPSFYMQITSLREKCSSNPKTRVSCLTEGGTQIY